MGDKVNLYSQTDSDILALQLTADKILKGYHQLTLTEYDTTTVPAIAAGSGIEVNGALYKFDTEEAISTTDPVTSATVADGTVYVVVYPSSTTQCAAAFTATAPTWSDSKQGWYGAGSYANYRYLEFIMLKATTSYSMKRRFKDYLTNQDIVGIKCKSFTGTITGGAFAVAHGIANAYTNRRIKHINAFRDNGSILEMANWTTLNYDNTNINGTNPSATTTYYLEILYI